MTSIWPDGKLNFEKNYEVIHLDVDYSDSEMTDVVKIDDDDDDDSDGPSQPSFWMSQLSPLVETSSVRPNPTIDSGYDDTLMQLVMSVGEGAEQREKEKRERDAAMEEAKRLRVEECGRQIEERKKKKEEEEKREEEELSDSALLRKYDDF